MVIGMQVDPSITWSPAPVDNSYMLHMLHATHRGSCSPRLNRIANRNPLTLTEDLQASLGLSRLLHPVLLHFTTSMAPTRSTAPLPVVLIG